MSSALFGANFSTAQIAVTTTAARIVAKSNSAPRANAGIVLKAPATNSDVLYIGSDATVTSSTGFPLAAGDTSTIPIDDPSKVFAIAGSGTQTLALMYV